MIEMERYDQSLARREIGVPSQYITGHQEFWGINLIVSPAVLIPRPETEHVIEAVLEIIKKRSEASEKSAPLTRIIDVGTGSGAIAIALATEIVSAELHAVDISAAAVAVARTNIERHNLASRIALREADLLEEFEPASVDFVVSNPPYVGESEEDTVQLEVRKFEPRNAVFAGREGLDIIERLIPQAHRVLKRQGWLVFEISGAIAERVRALLGDWQSVGIKKDLQGISRVAVAQKP